MTKLEASKSKPARKWEPGKWYTCTMSKSPGYRVGASYQCLLNADGHAVLTASDGRDDLCVMLVSAFVPLDEYAKGVVSDRLSAYAPNGGASVKEMMGVLS